MAHKPYRIALAGLGTVGAEVARQIAHHPHLKLVAVSARDPKRDRKVDLSGVHWVDAPIDLAGSDADVVVELMGGADGPALDLALGAINAKKPLVTANKAMLAKHWQPLFSSDVPVRFEAAVCGGIPIIKVLREGLAGNRITRISGILNGTCNYILSTMESQGRSFDDVLKEAQALGFAEADPTLDIDGFDAGHKLVILAKLAFDPAITLEQIDISGIRDITLADIQAAKAKGQTIRLVAGADKDGLSVRAVALPKDHPLSHVTGAMNAVTILAEPVDTCTLIGPGAGAGPTASAVMADILDLARNG